MLLPSSVRFDPRTWRFQRPHWKGRASEAPSPASTDTNNEIGSFPRLLCCCGLSLEGLSKGALSKIHTSGGLSHSSI